MTKQTVTAGGVFVDASGEPAGDLDFWEPIVFTGDEIDREVARLEGVAPPANGRREARLVHPRATPPGLGLAPGIEVTLSVLKPGERTLPVRHTSTQVNFCLRGSGHTVVDGRQIRFSRYDVWNHPSYRTYWHVNDNDDLQVRLTYSNAPLLEKMNVHIVEDNPPERPVVPPEEKGTSRRQATPLETLRLADDGAMLMPYEALINPPIEESRPLHWPWTDVEAHLDKLVALGADYRGRRLYLLYNPATGRTNGTTPSFFATMTIRPPGIVDRPHRHSSAAINYFFRGSGHSRIGGRLYHWKAGDLMLTAPGWMIHNHASDDDYVYELTVQDQPLHLAMESLLWQEDLKTPARVLGSQPGFVTNRTEVG